MAGSVVVRREPFRAQRAEAIMKELSAFENRYGVPSEKMARAFMYEGQLHETEDYQRWRFLWSIYERLQRSKHPLPAHLLVR